jgi:hypothetical protein
MGGWTLKGEHEWSECSVQFDGDGSYHTIYEPGRRLPVAFVIGTGRHWRDNEAEDTATARLIASAPELLEAAKSGFLAVVGLKMAIAVESNGWQWPDDAPDTVPIPAENLRAAIAKATGEAS